MQLERLFHIWPIRSMHSNEIHGDLLVMSLNKLHVESPKEVRCLFGSNRIRTDTEVLLSLDELKKLDAGSVVRKVIGGMPRALRRCGDLF